MKTNPYADDDQSKASEYLRLALPLLSRYQIPPSPLNFRMGYDAVAGNNELLAAAFNELTEQGERSLETKDLWELYHRFYVQDERALQNMREELQRIIANLQGDLRRSGEDLSQYSVTLNHFAEILESPSSPEVISSEVNKVLGDTHSMKLSQRQLESQMSSILSEVTSLRKELEQVKEESMTDALTSIANRRAFDATLENTILSARKQNIPFCILIVDIDRFKQFNDTHGHLVGDKVLRFVAATLKRCVKGKDMVARFGGEEFAVILPGTILQGAESVAEQIRKEVSAGDLKDQNQAQNYGRLTVSVGITQFRNHDLPNELVHRADRALYLAKERGRNRVESMS